LRPRVRLSFAGFRLTSVIFVAARLRLSR
jgi:hypothetical protein